MQDGLLIARGQILSHKPSTFEGKTSVAVQMLKRTSKGAREILNIKMPDGTSAEECMKTYPEDSEFEFAVDIVAVESSAYFRFVRDLKADSRAAGRTPATKPSTTTA
jgi:hypothetical protein